MSSTDTRNVDIYNNSEPFALVYPNYNLDKLPSWVVENISLVRVYGSQRRCLILPDGRKYHLDNKLNDSTGRDWTLFINSVFSTHYPTKGSESYAHDIRKIHPSPKPPQLMRDVISFFTKENEMVFDCFCGVGGTLIGASLCNRNAAGIDLNSEYLKAYALAAKSLNLKVYETLQGNSLEILKDANQMQSLLFKQPISLMLIDPPYANMMSKVKTGGDISTYGNIATPFTNEETDLGNMTRENFLGSLKLAVEQTMQYMKKESYVVVFIKDIQPSKKEINLLHAEVITKLNEIPKLYYKGLKIWADTSAKMYPYGYPFSFVANQIHQYILVFRKEK